MSNLARDFSVISYLIMISPSPTDLPCCHTFCRTCILPYLRKNPQCPQCRKPAQVHECRDSSLALRRICDKLKVKCPKCGYETERNLLSDHIPKCGKVEKSPVKQPINDRSGRPREVKNGKVLTKIKWHRSRDRLNGRSRDRLDGRGRSRSRDALDQIENRGRVRQERGRSRSTENLVESSEPQFDLAREIERDIERINLAQGKQIFSRALEIKLILRTSHTPIHCPKFIPSSPINSVKFSNNWTSS